MQNYLWILNALTEHYGHLKQWGQDRNAKILFFYLFFFPTNCLDIPVSQMKSLRLVGREGRVLCHHPGTALLFQQFLIRMLRWTTTEPCHIPQRWHGCSVVQNVGHKCSPFLREEALALEHKPFSPFHGLQSVWNSPDLWVLRVCFLLSLLSSPKSRE